MCSRPSQISHSMDSSLLELLLGLGVAISSLAAVTILTSGMVWAARRATKRASQESSHPPDIGDPGKLNNNDSEFRDISDHLQNDLKCHIEDKLRLIKIDINVRKIEMTKKIETLLDEKRGELAVAEAKFLEDKKVIEAKFKGEKDKILKEFKDEEEELKESVKNLRVVLATDESVTEMVETTRSELECPVCLEEMKPLRRIWQCSDGHAVCEFCRKKPEVTCCPTCRKYIVGRSTIAEKLARSLFSAQTQGVRGREGEEETNKITLTGYRQVKIERDYS